MGAVLAGDPHAAHVQRAIELGPGGCCGEGERGAAVSSVINSRTAIRIGS
jgi:hypothetical protein